MTNTKLALIVDTALNNPNVKYFGRRKAFVSSVWEAIKAHPDVRAARMTLASFKAQLLACNTSDLLELARADLVAAMDRADIDASVINDRFTTWHFIVNR